MTDQDRFTITSLIDGKSAVVRIMPVATAETQAAIAADGLHGPKGLGLEIGNIAALPDTKDYTLDEFYRANFTASEIAHCTKQAAVKAAFQGLLTAKRAIIKSGAASAPPQGLSSIEVSFDGEGRPTYPGCLLSFSDTGTIAAAVCLWLGGLALQAPSVGAAGTARPQPLRFKWRTRIFAFLVLLSLLALFGLGLWKALEMGRG